MPLESNIVEVLASVYRPAFENTTMKSTLYDLGMVNVRNEMSNTQLVFRKQNNLGGFLNYRANGENISVTSGGLNYRDEKVIPYGFADSRSVPVGQIGLRNPESLNPSDRDTLARVATGQMDELMTAAANTLRLWTALSVLPSITVDGITFTNSKVDSTGYAWTGAGDTWANTANDIIGNLFNLKANFYGSGIPAGGLTVLHSSKQTFNLIRNTGLANLVGFDQSSYGQTPSAILYTKLQEVLAVHGISLIEWNDAYYANNNEANPYNVTKFLNDNYIVIIPNAYFQRRPGSLVLEQVSASSNTAPFIELITAPSADFEYKTRRQAGNFGGAGVIPGAYVYSGIYEDQDPGKPDSYKTGVALDIGLFVEGSLGIKYIQVQS